MDNKRKTKLVCVGWTVVFDRKAKKPWMLRSHYRTREKAIRAYNTLFGPSVYTVSRRRGFAIAKKLWVEVKDGN